MSTEDPELTPAQEDAVRRQLAAARHDEPIPAAVVARLDRVLDGLAEERAKDPAGERAGETPVHAPVVDLAARRRRRRATQLLVAAVAIVAVGFGFGQLTGSMDGGSGDSSSAGADSMPEGTKDAPTDSDDSAGAISPEALSELATVTRKRFEQDVAATKSQLFSTGADSTRAELAARKACLKPGPDEQAVAVEYAGRLATLVYRAPANDLQKVDLYRCNPPGFVRSTQIPAP